MIRIATTDDVEFLVAHDHEVPAELMRRKVADGQVYVVTSEDGQILGWLRYGLFWDLIPFMNMLYMLEPNRRKGYGRRLVERWELDMRERGYEQVMTSTLSNEEAQHFYRHLGYVDAGAFVLPGEPAELIFQKSIH